MEYDDKITHEIATIIKYEKDIEFHGVSYVGDRKKLLCIWKANCKENFVNYEVTLYEGQYVTHDDILNYLHLQKNRLLTGYYDKKTFYCTI